MGPWKLAGIIAGVVGAIATLHAAFVVPAILYQAGEIAERKLTVHETRPHKGAVTREEMALFVVRFEDYQRSTAKDLEEIKVLLRDRRGQ